MDWTHDRLAMVQLILLHTRGFAPEVRFRYERLEAYLIECINREEQP